ncbi:hypothetical protein SPONL_172 [uncultured Candidatus Thioglobus sp.]|nr:hypothetical protein SPONL_172 [uncultured Candidatus Thioglobus sp.]
MKRTIMQLFFFILLIFLSGCVSKYPTIKNTYDSSFIEFERNVTYPKRSSTVVFEADESYYGKCKRNFTSGKRMAILSTDYLVSNENEAGLKVPPGRIKMSIQHTASNPKFITIEEKLSGCNTFIDFNVAPNQKYKVVSYAHHSFWRSPTVCSAEVLKLNTNKIYEKIKINQYLCK